MPAAHRPPCQLPAPHAVPRMRPAPGVPAPAVTETAGGRSHVRRRAAVCLFVSRPRRSGPQRSCLPQAASPSTGCGLQPRWAGGRSANQAQTPRAAPAGESTHATPIRRGGAPSNRARHAESESERAMSGRTTGRDDDRAGLPIPTDDEGRPCTWPVRRTQPLTPPSSLQPHTPHPPMEARKIAATAEVKRRARVNKAKAAISLKSPQRPPPPPGFTPAQRRPPKPPAEAAAALHHDETAPLLPRPEGARETGDRCCCVVS